MSWRKAAGAILFSPILIGLLVFVALIVILKLPSLYCERRRAIRYLPYLGLAYYGLTVPLLLAALGLAWWQVVIGTGLIALGGDWLLPDPFSYLFNWRKRRAVKLAIEYVEAREGPWPIYGMVSVVGSESSRTIVSVALKSDTIPPARLFFAVAGDIPKVDLLDFEQVSKAYGVSCVALTGARV